MTRLTSGIDRRVRSGFQPWGVASGWYGGGPLALAGFGDAFRGGAPVLGRCPRLGWGRAFGPRWVRNTQSRGFPSFPSSIQARAEGPPDNSLGHRPRLIAPTPGERGRPESRCCCTESRAYGDSDATRAEAHARSRTTKRRATHALFVHPKTNPRTTPTHSLQGRTDHTCSPRSSSLERSWGSRRRSHLHTSRRRAGPWPAGSHRCSSPHRWAEATRRLAGRCPAA